MTDTDRAPVLRARGLCKKYGKDAGLVRAVDGVDLDVSPGETVALTTIPARLATRHSPGEILRSETG